MAVLAETQRDPWLDNAKFIILALVVIGHLAEAYIKQSDSLHDAFNAIYLFHMPAIIFLLGRFVRPVRSVHQGFVTLEQSLIPYVLFQFVFIAAMTAMQDKGFDADTFGFAALIRPQYGLWFLIALGAWRVAISVVPKHSAVMAASVVAALLVGYADDINRDFAAARVVNFLPFYLAGHFYGAPILAWLRRQPPSLGIVLLAVALFVATQIWTQKDTRLLFQAAEPFAKTKLEAELAWAHRALHLGLASMAVAGFLILVPRGRGWMTTRGQNTLYIYLFHLLPVRALQILILPAAFKGATSFAILPIAAVMIWAFSHPQFARLARPVAEPRWLSNWWRGRH